MAWTLIYSFATGGPSPTPTPGSGGAGGGSGFASSQRGQDGNRWLRGKRAPKQAQGAAGDFYLQQSNGNVWHKAEPAFGQPATWQVVMNLKYPTPGPKGDPGPVGQPGAPGGPGTPGATGPAGTPGTPGTPGADGAPGANGTDGATGAAGVNGVGNPGPKGQDGATWIPGTIAPTPGQGRLNDFYFQTNGDVYNKQAPIPFQPSAWNRLANLTGPAGQQGQVGQQGTPAYMIGQKGQDGATWLYGIGPPSAKLGKPGDMYLDTKAADIWGKQLGFFGQPPMWQKLKSIQGPAGKPGKDGLPGAPGQPGSPGVSLNQINGLQPNTIPCGRLTGTSGDPYDIQVIGGFTTLYYTPYNGNFVRLYNPLTGTWSYTTFSEISQAVYDPGIGNTLPVDVFVYLNGGNLTLEQVPWTNATTRATALALQDGMYVKSTSKDRLFVGSMATTNVGVGSQSKDAYDARWLCNNYNKLQKGVQKFEAAASWTYASATWRQANANTANAISMMQCFADTIIDFDIQVICLSLTVGENPCIGVGVNSTTVNSGTIYQYGANLTTATFLISAGYVGATAGYTVYNWIEKSYGGGNVQFRGSDTDTLKSGFLGLCFC